MKTISGLTLLSVILAGCISTEDRIAQMQQADNAACRAYRGEQFNACIASRMQYRQLATQQEAADAAQRHAFGERLQRAAAALKSNQPPMQPSQTTQCHMIGDMLQCHTF